MKYCGRCGTALRDDCAFCGVCGMAQYAPIPQKMSAKQKFECLGTAKIFFVMSVVASLLMLFLPFLNTWEVSALGMKEESEAFYDYSPIMLLGWTLFLGSIACVTIPLYTAKPYKASQYIFGIIAKALVIILMLVVNSETKELASISSGAVDAGLTFGGWLMLLVLLAGLFADIKMMLVIKKHSR